MSWKWYIQAQYELVQSGASPESLIKASIAWCFSDTFLSKGNTFNDYISLRSNNPHPFSLKGFAGQMAALNDFDSRDWLTTIELPCLIVTGREDIIFPKRCCKAIVHLIRNSRYYEFEQTGHLPHVEAPEKFAGLVLDFFQH